MEPLTGFILYGVFALFVAAIAKKKGLKAGAYFAVILVLGPAVVMGTSVATQGTASGALAAMLAFFIPIIGLVVVLLAKNGQLVQRQLLLPVATTRFAGFRRLTC